MSKIPCRSQAIGFASLTLHSPKKTSPKRRHIGILAFARSPKNIGTKVLSARLAKKRTLLSQRLAPVKNASAAPGRSRLLINVHYWRKGRGDNFERFKLFA